VEQLRPDTEKLLALATTLDAIPNPNLNSEEGKAILGGVRTKLLTTSKFIRSEVAKLTKKDTE
jgi:hypothetical protein